MAGKIAPKATRKPLEIVYFFTSKFIFYFHKVDVDKKIIAANYLEQLI